MNQEKLEAILVLTRRIGNLFNEILDITMQLGNALDRRDEVSVKMVVDMRSEPVDRLTTADHALREQLSSLDETDALRIRAILNGDGAQASDPLEKILAEQAAMNIRTHKKLIELDKIVNRKVTQEKSVYQ